MLLTIQSNALQNPLLIPSILSQLALKSAIVTGGGMYMNPVEEDGNLVFEITLEKESELSQTIIEEFKKSSIQMLQIFAKMSKIEFQAEWNDKK